jgi:hypothetical protein
LSNTACVKSKSINKLKANIGRLDRQEFVSSIREAEARKVPCQGSTLLPTLVVRNSQSEALKVLSLTGRPRYIMGNFPSLQFRRRATLSCSTAVDPTTTTSLLERLIFRPDINSKLTRISFKLATRICRLDQNLGSVATSPSTSPYTL